MLPKSRPQRIAYRYHHGLDIELIAEQFGMTRWEVVTTLKAEGAIEQKAYVAERRRQVRELDESGMKRGSIAAVMGIDVSEVSNDRQALRKTKGRLAA